MPAQETTPAAALSPYLPLASLLVLPGLAYAIGAFALPAPANVQVARATVNRKAMEGDVVLKQAPAPALAANANFGNQITVLGLDVSNPTPRIGESIEMTFYYRCEAEMQQSWRVFLHIDSSKAQFRIHGDHDPKGYSTDKWAKGDTLADRHTQAIPLDAPKGSYDVWMGFYDPAHEDDRLALVPGQQGVTSDGANRVKLGTITVQ